MVILYSYKAHATSFPVPKKFAKGATCCLVLLHKLVDDTLQRFKEGICDHYR